MHFLSAFTGKVAAHFGLTDTPEGENRPKLSASGCLGFTYQLLAVLILTGFVLFNGNATAVGLVPTVLLTALAAFLFIAGARLLCGIANGLIARISSKVSNKWLTFPVNLALVLAFAAAVMATPGAVLYVLAKTLPAYVSFAGWAAACTSGMLVLAADSVLGQLTGVSLFTGKARAAKAAAKPEDTKDATGSGAAPGTPDATTDGDGKTDGK